MADVAAVVVAAGQGTRAGGEWPKEFRRVGGETLLRRALLSFADAPEVDRVQPVIRSEDLDLVRTLTGDMDVLPPVCGGGTRQASVRAGLEALSGHAPDIVLVHDAARPFASLALIARAIAAAQRTGAAVPALPVTDTIKSVNADHLVDKTLDRSALRLIQTPQAFAYGPLLDAHRRAAAQGREDFTDDAALAEWAGMKVSVFAGEPGNIKLTTDDDFARAETMHLATLGDVRAGMGIDVHAFGPGDYVMLGGLRIPHSRALTGHSDADVVLHALTDAILGALAEGDIARFPPSDRNGAALRPFLASVDRVKAPRASSSRSTIVCRLRVLASTAMRCARTSPDLPASASTVWR
jgi:2-C-methyl-D-erythritol 4-phosphate cytidylyltransferase/2-C-methyl-D-erythritol 2,4-cyclodiphosphate synthase